MAESFDPTIKQDTPEGKEKLVRRILIAEDEHLIRDNYVDFFEAQGFIVDVVSDGQMLLDKLYNSTEKYDLVITDNNMPAVTGLEALKKIRGDERFNNLPIMMVSAEEGKVEDEVKALDLTAFMYKPSLMADMLKKAEELWEKVDSR
ncbi:response regulator [Candidatus Nomurabacteria bacterium]|nr:response regulator [Candidatus Nomurabacteria bacterium]